MGDFECSSPDCRFAGSFPPCEQWKGGCSEGRFRELVSRFDSWGAWQVHEWAKGSNKYYAKLFGEKGCFVTIEDYSWADGGFTVSARLRASKDESRWVDFKGLSWRDGSLWNAVARACDLAGIREKVGAKNG